MKLDAKTIAAFGTAVSVIIGGAELRLKVQSIDDRLSRIERRVDAPGSEYASVGAQHDVQAR